MSSWRNGGKEKKPWKQQTKEFEYINTKSKGERDLTDCEAGRIGGRVSRRSKRHRGDPEDQTWSRRGCVGARLPVRGGLEGYFYECWNQIWDHAPWNVNEIFQMWNSNLRNRPKENFTSCPLLLSFLHLPPSIPSPLPPSLFSSPAPPSLRLFRVPFKNVSHSSCWMEYPCAYTRSTWLTVVLGPLISLDLCVVCVCMKILF